MWRAWRTECITLETRLVLLDTKASTPTLNSSNICTSIALHQSNMYKQIQTKIMATFIQAYVQGWARLEGWARHKCDGIARNSKHTGIAFYTGINVFYQPLRDFYTPFTPFYGSLRPFTNHLFAKQQHKSAIMLIWFWLYHAQDQVIEAYFQ